MNPEGEITKFHRQIAEKRVGRRRQIFSVKIKKNDFLCIGLTNAQLGWTKLSMGKLGF